MKARGEALSQSEIEALLASMPGEEGEAAPAPPQQNDKGLRTWDFRKPDKFSKDHLRSLLALHQTFSRERRYVARKGLDEPGEKGRRSRHRSIYEALSCERRELTSERPWFPTTS